MVCLAGRALDVPRFCCLLGRNHEASRIGWLEEGPRISKLVRKLAGRHFLVVSQLSVARALSSFRQQGRRFRRFR